MSIPHANTRAAIIRELAKLYPEPNSELEFNGEYQLLCAVLLSAQCTDKKVNQVSPFLFTRYPNAAKLANADVRILEEILRPINYYKTKSKHLIKMASLLVENFDGEIPKTHKELISLPGVGNKTANVVLSELGIEDRFPVDTHVFRVSKRLGFAKSKSRDIVEKEVSALFDPSLWRPLHHWLILHGRRVCIARRPKCDECTIRRFCPTGQENKE